jgi:hypothetical protein
MKTILSIWIFFIFFIPNGISQSPSDSTPKLPDLNILTIKKHSPKLASYLSIIPGAGQIYNKKYWKVPVIYAGLGSAAFLIYYFNDISQYYREEYVYRINNNAPFLHPELEDALTDNVLALRNVYRSRMEIAIAAFAIIYTLNIIDAAVDAHLYNFDISDDLSMIIKPTVQTNYIQGNYCFTPSIGLKLKFK